MLRHDQSPSSESNDPSPQRSQDLESRQQQNRASRPRRELAANPKSRAQTMEAREQLSSSEPGGNSGLPFQDHFRRSVANSPDRESVQRAVTQECDLESNDAPGNARECQSYRLKSPSMQGINIYATKPRQDIKVEVKFSYLPIEDIMTVC